MSELGYSVRVIPGAPDFNEETGSLRFITVDVLPGGLHLSEDTILLIAQSAVSSATGIDLEEVEQLVIEATFTGDQWIVAIHDEEI